jgi:hypothetical protein
VLTEQQLRLYARQVILRELGQAGQAQLCAAEVALAEPSPAGEIAADYLRRAGVQVVTGPALSLAVPSAAQVDAIAGEPALQACAEWLAGAWTAVETIKQCVGVGSPARSDLSPLTAEID